MILGNYGNIQSVTIFSIKYDIHFYTQLANNIKMKTQYKKFTAHAMNLMPYVRSYKLVKIIKSKSNDKKLISFANH